jgi:hypothetical protein
MRWASSVVPIPFSVTSRGRRRAGVVPGAPQAVAEGLRVELVAHVEHGDPRLVAGPPVGADEHAGVDLHAQEVVAAGGVEEDVLGVVADALELLLAARGRLVVGHGQRQADRHPGSGAPGWPRRPRCPGHEVGATRYERSLSVLPGGNIPACQPMVATMLGSLMVQARVMTSPSASATTAQKRAKRSTGVAALPAAPGRQPARGGEVVEGDDGVDAPLPQPGALAPVVLEGGPGELALGRLDPAPLDREAVVVQAQVGHQVGVLLPAVPRVAGVARRLGAARARRVLELPPVVVGVAALDLVGRRGRPPGEALGKARPAPCRRPLSSAMVSPLLTSVTGRSRESARPARYR